MRQGELWLLELPDAKARPALIVARDATVGVAARVVVAPVTSTEWGVPSELAVGPGDGLDHDSIASFDNLATVPKANLTKRLGALGPDGRERICTALRALADC